MHTLNNDARRLQKAIVARTRSQIENTPYVHQSFPSVRFHADGRVVTVADQEADDLLGPDWSTKAPPPPPVVVPLPPPTVEELSAAIEMLRASNAELKAGNDELRSLHTELRAELARATRKSKPLAPVLAEAKAE